MTESRTNSDHAIPISSLIQAYRCPRRFYFSRHDPVESSGKYTICKQVSLCNDPDPDEDSLWDEICLIDPGIKPEMREYLSRCLMQTAHMPLPSWTDSDVPVSSDKYGIHGLIDKYDEKAGVISVIRNSGAPTVGCWPGDRVRIAAYLLCLRESLGKDLTGGYVEYIPDGIVRFCEPQSRDRRGLLQALKNARMVLQGDLPPKPVRAPCRNCTYQNRCNSEGVKTLSEIFFKKR